MSSTALVWLRRDLRVADQPALLHAALVHDRVIPVYIHAPEEESPWVPGAASQWWLHHSLIAMAGALARLGSPLVIRRGESLSTLRQLVAETGATAVYWNRLYEPAVIARDARVKQALRDDGLLAESFNGALLFEPWTLKTGAGEPYKVYTPMFRAAEALFNTIRAPLAAPERLVPATRPLASDPVESLKLRPTIPWDQGFHQAWTPGEAGAQRRLETFATQAIAHYKERRDQPALDEAVSGLSPHLHFGELSPQQAFARARQADAEHTADGAHGSIQHFIKEVFWREFSHHLLYHFPHTPQAPLYAKFEAFPWRAAEDYAADLRAWQQGRTGIPIVNAGMRQLWISGWMHNRVRMIVASVLTKNLLIPWQEGAQWFWDTLVDASLPQNTSGWQWTTGCGADAAPYFRIFNPVLQGEKFDAAGAYVRRWVPELAKLPAKFIHRPWEAPSEVRRAAGIGIDHIYARPLVDLMATRDRALAAYARIEGSAGA
jgi:deoxyribodipyrimidine photo-lyase